jgi:acetyltransferase-like isoleucine patch superfamily enzyme
MVRLYQGSREMISRVLGYLKRKLNKWSGVSQKPATDENIAPVVSEQERWKQAGVVLGDNSQIVGGRAEKRSQFSEIMIGNDCLIHGELVTEIDASKIKIGNNVFIGGATLIDCIVSVTIEDDVLVSYQCIIADSDNHNVDYFIRRVDLSDWRRGYHDWSKTLSAPIKICKGAWIGARSIILKGVTIGEAAVVGAGSVVTKDVPPWTVVAGNPARVIRKIPHTREVSEG